jgi:hypothetical protein
MLSFVLPLSLHYQNNQKMKTLILNKIAKIVYNQWIITEDGAGRY